ncbi:MAG: hypothetical protein BWX70_03402 [Verrucomicrobia bacterium ADurb.Bin070]|nr:MAG: hypothetical protein BWX70_03402 [Verrucomicrobia bacterium ADurb.Bin070]
MPGAPANSPSAWFLPFSSRVPPVSVRGTPGASASGTAKPRNPLLTVRRPVKVLVAARIQRPASFLIKACVPLPAITPDAVVVPLPSRCSVYAPRSTGPESVTVPCP